jgi:hypothetical protein
MIKATLCTVAVLWSGLVLGGLLGLPDKLGKVVSHPSKAINCVQSADGHGAQCEFEGGTK